MLVATYALQESLPPPPMIVVAPPVELIRLMSLPMDWEDFEDDEEDTPPVRSTLFPVPNPQEDKLKEMILDHFSVDTQWNPKRTEQRTNYYMS